MNISDYDPLGGEPPQFYMVEPEVDENLFCPVLKDWIAIEDIDRMPRAVDADGLPVDSSFCGYRAV